ncbi:unnamed protein product [Jaminaea pallidilutea]
MDPSSSSSPSVATKKGAASAYPAVVRGIFGPSTSTPQLEAIQQFLGEQHTLFLSLDKIHKEATSGQSSSDKQTRGVFDIDEDGGPAFPDGVPSSSHLPYYTRLFNLVIQSNRDLLDQLIEQRPSEASSSPSTSSIDFASHVSRTTLPILTLAQTLYLSPNALEAHYNGAQGIVGEELLHWLNSYDYAPTTEQGREIASSAEPHMHPSYWDYILRCTLRGFHSTVSTLLSTLLSLPSPALTRLIENIRELVGSLPRSLNFKTEVQFKSARREFHLRLMSVLASLEGVMDEVQEELNDDDEEEQGNEEEAEDLRLSLEAGLRIFLEVLAGNKERVVEAAEDWREALAAWGTLVDVGLKRDGLSEALSTILKLRGDEEEAASAEVDKYERILQQLIRGETSSACRDALAVDPYIAQVLADYFTKLDLISEEAASGEAASEPSLLERTNLVYANTLLSTFGLWRMALDYLSHAKMRGRARMSQVLIGVPLLESQDSKGSSKQHKTAPVDGIDESSSQDGEESKDEFHLVESILEACQTFGFVHEARVVCRKMALYLSATPQQAATSTMSSLPRYGPAFVFALRSLPRRDETAIKIIKRRLLMSFLERKLARESRLRKDKRGINAAGTADVSHSSPAEEWFQEQIRDIKRAIIRSRRMQEERASETSPGDERDGTAYKSPFIRRRGQGIKLDGSSQEASEEEQLLLEDEEEWNRLFARDLPGPVLLLTNLSYFFTLKSRSRANAQETGSSNDAAHPSSVAAAAFLIELLNSGLVDGDWVAICLYEVGQVLPSSTSVAAAALDSTGLYDVLRILENCLFQAGLSRTEEKFALIPLARWLGYEVPVLDEEHDESDDDEGHEGDDEQTYQTAIRAARRELEQRLRYKVAMGLTIPAIGSQDYLAASGANLPPFPAAMPNVGGQIGGFSGASDLEGSSEGDGVMVDDAQMDVSASALSGDDGVLV